MSHGVRYLDLADFLLIASAVLELDVEVLAHHSDLHLADAALNAPRAGFGDVELYPDFSMKAAVLCWHVIRDHPLLDGNKRTGYLCMTEFIERNGYTWSRGDDETGDDTVEMMVAVADGTATAEELAAWADKRIGKA